MVGWQNLGCTAWCFTVRKGCTGNKKHHTSQPGTTCEHCIRIVDSTALPPAVSQVTASFSKGRCILPINNQRSVSRKGSDIDVGFYIHMCCKTQNHMIYSSAQRAYAKKQTRLINQSMSCVNGHLIHCGHATHQHTTLRGRTQSSLQQNASSVAMRPASVELAV